MVSDERQASITREGNIVVGVGGFDRFWVLVKHRIRSRHDGRSEKLIDWNMDTKASRRKQR